MTWMICGTPILGNFHVVRDWTHTHIYIYICWSNKQAAKYYKRLPIVLTHEPLSKLIAFAKFPKKRYHFLLGPYRYPCFGKKEERKRKRKGKGEEMKRKGKGTEKEKKQERNRKAIGKNRRNGRCDCLHTAANSILSTVQQQNSGDFTSNLGQIFGEIPHFLHNFIEKLGWWTMNSF